MGEEEEEEEGEEEEEREDDDDDDDDDDDYYDDDEDSRGPLGSSFFKSLEDRLECHWGLSWASWEPLGASLGPPGSLFGPREGVPSEAL